jgi:C_GCAxxG_C_C family probable redox protein
MTDDSGVAQRAGDLFDSGLNCTESLLVAFAEESSIDCPAFPKLATGFCAGVSRTCGMCGAVSGGVMAIGLRLGRNSAEDSNEECYSAVQSYKHSFEERFGSENCRALTGCDFGTQEGRDAFEERNLHPQCRHYVEVAAELAIAAIGP